MLNTVFNMRPKPFTTILLAATLMIMISVVFPVYFKHWFVENSGNFRLLTGIGPLLAIGLLLRLRVIVLSTIMYGFGAWTCLYLMWSSAPKFQAGFALLTVLQIILLFLLFSSPVKTYLDRIDSQTDRR